MGWFSKSVTIEAQLVELTRAGIRANAGVGEQDLCAFHTRAEIEAAPYRYLIEVLGIDIEREPFTPMCDRLWMCDFERIEDHGSYAEVLERLERMTGGVLRLAAIRDHVDIEGEIAWLEFEHGSRTVKWEFEVNDDWLDPVLLRRYQHLLGQAGGPMRLFINERDYGQSALLGAFAPEEKAAFDFVSKVKLVTVEAERSET